jgi:cob(I)alamin adenosyltransferase
MDSTGEIMKIYTKTGDKGKTSLFTGQRVQKDNPFIEALGAVDECNSAIGWSLAHFPNDSTLHKTREQLITIQHALFDVGAAIATPRTTAVNTKLEKTRFDDEEIEALEKWIDEMESHLPKLNCFILPGGAPAGAALHMARSLCRTAERRAIPLHEAGDIADNVLIYLNRLSDYLFVASRYVNHILESPETFWQHNKLTQKI